MIRALVIITILIQGATVYSKTGVEKPDIEVIEDHLPSAWELFEDLEGFEEAPNYVLWRTNNGTNSTDSEPFVDPVVAAAAVFIGVPIALLAAAPSPLPMFPPEGLPQPGTETEGAGVLPSSSLTVI